MSVSLGMKPIALVACLAITGCAATSTAISKRNLDVQTKMSDSIFLDPVSPDERTVFVDVRNTSDRPDFNIEPEIRSAVEGRGFRVVDDPDQANFLLQANVLQAGRSSESAAEDAFGGGFGSVLTGGAIGGATGFGLGQAGGSDILLTLGGALLGAAIATAADSFVQDVTYSIVTDLQISERAAPGQIVEQTEKLESSQGSGGTVTQRSDSTTEWKRYRSRVVSTANQANLEWPEAAPDLVSGLTRSVGGIF